MGGSTGGSFSEAIIDHDEPPHGTSPNPQETVVVLLSFKPIFHWSFDSLRGRRWH